MAHRDRIWFKLDNAAKLYPAILSRRNSTIFRIGGRLRSHIQAEALQLALRKTIARYPYFKVHLKRGIFWYYLEEQHSQPLVAADSRFPCEMMNIKSGKDFLFRVRAYDKNIACEFSHTLTDGTGALTFFKTLLMQYFEETGLRVDDWGDIPKPHSDIHPEEYEDSFRKYYNPSIPKYKLQGKAFHLPYKLADEGKYFISSGYITVKEVLDKARQHGASLTAFLGALLIESFQDVLFDLLNSGNAKMNKIIRVVLPVNLRKIFPSRSLRNFFLPVTIDIDTRLGRFSFDEILTRIQTFIKTEVNEKMISRQIGRNVRGELGILNRSVPLFIKNPVISYVFKKMGESYNTIGLSNLGRIDLPEEVKDLVDEAHFYLNPSPLSKINMGMVSINGRLTLSFGSNVRETEIEKRFFRKLTSLNINVRIKTNR